MKKKVMMYFAAIVVIIMTALVSVLFASGAGNSQIEFLSGYGWEVSPRAIEKAEVIIPNPFDRVYENYNELQLRAGLDLRPYMGMRCMRYTYTVTNYPRDIGEEVRANVLCVDGVPVGGDIMTVSYYGFMHSLNFSDAQKS